MKINDFERMISEQHSMLRAFPSHSPTIEQQFSGQNQRMALQMQIETAKLSAAHDRKLDKVSEILHALLQSSIQQQASMLQREELEDQRYQETSRLTKIAAWSGVGSLFLAILGIAAQIAFK